MSTAPSAAKAEPKTDKSKAKPAAPMPAAAKAAGKPTADAAARSTTDTAAKPAKKPTRKMAAPVRKKKPSEADAARPVHSESRLAQVLVAPIVSEKATMVAEKHNQVLFKVLRDATKPEIKAAVELMFKVDVESVRTVQHKGKTKRFGKSIGRRDHVKKAYVGLAAGQELNFSGEAA